MGNYNDSNFSSTFFIYFQLWIRQSPCVLFHKVLRNHTHINIQKQVCLSKSGLKKLHKIHKKTYMMESFSSNFANSRALNLRWKHFITSILLSLVTFFRTVFLSSASNRRTIITKESWSFTGNFDLSNFVKCLVSEHLHSFSWNSFYSFIFNKLFTVDWKNSSWTNLHRLTKKLIKWKFLTSTYKQSIFRVT